MIANDRARFVPPGGSDLRKDASAVLECERPGHPNRFDFILRVRKQLLVWSHFVLFGQLNEYEASSGEQVVLNGQRSVEKGIEALGRRLLQEDGIVALHERGCQGEGLGLVAREHDTDSMHES
jgi:hypothetical protein